MTMDPVTSKGQDDEEEKDAAAAAALKDKVTALEGGKTLLDEFFDTLLSYLEAKL